MVRTLIRGGWVLTMGRANHAEADVLIDGDTVAEVGTGLRARDAEVVDAADCIVMPGFVDSHRHTWESLFRNLGDAVDVTPGELGPHHRPDDIYAATLVGLLSAADAGITTVVDWCAVAVAPDHFDAALQAHADAAIRSVLVYASSPWAGGGWQPGLRRAAAANRPPLTTLTAGPADTGTDPSETEAAEWALARELGLRIHAHVGTRPCEAGGTSAIAARGLLGPDVTLAHASHLDDRDLDAVSSTGTSISMTPSSEMAAGGMPRVQALIDRGIRPGLGVATEQLAPGDMFAQMRAVISLQHATVFDRKLAGKAGLPRLLTTRDVIRYATVDGAAVAGLRGETGALEPGMKADVIVLRADRPNIHPVNDPIGAVVWGMDTSNVDWVFAGGRAIKRNGVLDADVDRVRRLATEAQRRVVEASGMILAAERR